jgi:hypothetical protein
LPYRLYKLKEKKKKEREKKKKEREKKKNIESYKN